MDGEGLMAETLEILLYGERVGSIDVVDDAWRHDRSRMEDSGLKDLSCTWTAEPGAGRLAVWLESLLPENGARTAMTIRALKKLAEQRGSPPGGGIGVGEILWGNTDSDYRGAVEFRRAGETIPETRWRRCNESELALALHRTADENTGNVHEDESTGMESRTSLSGMRPKIGIAQAQDGTWLMSSGQMAATAIAKHENRSHLRGEAGVESICQRAVGNLQIQSARTRTYVWDGLQVVVSHRSDRAIQQGEVVKLHQEEFCQAAGWPSELHHSQGIRGEPMWPTLYRMLKEHGSSEEAEGVPLTRVLAATWGIGHSDLHRRNIAVMHMGDGRIRLAPMYDVSSCIGVRHLHQRLAIGIEGQRRLDGIEPEHWAAQARQSGIDVETTLEVVRETVAGVPDALEKAQEEARGQDENIYQDDVGKRCARMVEHARKTSQRYEANLGTFIRRGRYGVVQTDTEMVQRLKAAKREKPEGTYAGAVQEDEKTVHVTWRADGTEDTPIGTVGSIEEMARLLVRAGVEKGTDLLLIERTLETERQAALAKARERGIQR